jgi:phospholipid-binding lipoprotein MlaA
MMIFSFFALAFLQGCATVPNPDARDPLESFNRGVFGFNNSVDRTLLKPVAVTYRNVMPSWLRKGVGNFFGNLEDVWSVANHALQGRREQTGNSLGRVMVNSTIGLLGIFDVASDLDIERNTTNFGATLGRWGMPSGPYIVLPLLGSRTLREVAALPVDNEANLVNYLGDANTVTGMQITNIIAVRANLLGAGDVLDGAALDKYSFVRDIYFQRQKNRESDGNPVDDESEP